MQTRGILRVLGLLSLFVVTVSGTAFAIPAPIEIASSTGNTLYTSSATVTLNLSSPGAAQMQFLTNNATWSAWGAYSATKTVLLPLGDGVKSVSVRFKDGDGNVSEIFSDSIILDTKAPAGSVAINDGAAATDSLDVTLSLAAVDANGVSLMRFSTDGGLHWSGWEPFAATASCTLSGTAGVPGTKKVLAQFQDPAGKSSLSAFDTILYVTTPPPAFTPGAVTIRNSTGGTDFTTTAGVKLSVENPGGYTQMSLSSNGTAWGGWIAVPATSETLIPYTLPAGDGIKTVYAKFRTGTTGTPSEFYGDTIVLDAKLPVGAVVIDGGAYSTSNPTVTLSLSAADLNGVSFMQFSATSLGLNTASWETFATSKDFPLSGSDGVKTVYVRFKDAAGKVSAICSDAIILDSTPPAGTVKINSGAATTTNSDVTLALTATGATEMNVSLDGGETWGGWEPFATSKKVTLPGGAGLKRVLVQFRDFTGNESDPVSDTITLNTLQGTYRIISRESSFWLSNGHVTDNIWSTTAVAAFIGEDRCTISFSATAYDKTGPDGSGNENVVPHAESGSATACSYAFTDNDPSTGEFTITMTTPEGPEQITGYVSADGNSVVLGGAKERVYPDGTGYDVDEMVGVRVGTGMTKGSLNGTYHLVGQEEDFFKSAWDGTTHVSESIAGNLITAEFYGNGGCSLGFDRKGYRKGSDGSGNETVTPDPENGTLPCTYTVALDGAFAITIPGEAGTHTGRVSPDGNTVVMGGARQEPQSNGTDYSVEQIVGVRGGTNMDNAILSGTYHLLGSELGFWQSTWGDGKTHVNDNIGATAIDVVFEGNGGCSVSYTWKGYWKGTDGSGNETVNIDGPESGTSTFCSYVVAPDGAFTINITDGEGGDTVSGWVSADGNSVVLGEAGEETDVDGTGYDVELIYGVRLKP